MSRAEGAELPDSVFHAKVVLDVVKEAVGDATVDKVCEQLPDEWRRLFDAASIKA